MNYFDIIEMLKGIGIIVENGLTEDEFRDIENFYEIQFPPDLKEFLRLGLPVSSNFINWRNKSESNIQLIREKLLWPLEGIIFDIENNSFWYEGWGNQPKTVEMAIEICKREYQKVPKMIPVFSHRYIPSVPQEEDNPIYSVYQTDIIYYGENLKSYLQVEFGQKKYQEINFNKIKHIEFWTDLVT